MIRPGEQSGYVAECLEIHVVTQGRTLDEVSRNLREAVELHLADEDLEALGLSPDPTIIATMEPRSMPGLRRLPGAEVIAILGRFGFVLHAQRGSVLKIIEQSVVFRPRAS